LIILNREHGTRLQPAVITFYNIETYTNDIVQQLDILIPFLGTNQKTERPIVRIYNC